MKIMEAITTQNIKLLFGNRWLILEDGTFYVFEHKFRKVTDAIIYKGQDEDTAVRFLIEGQSE